MRGYRKSSLIKAVKERIVFLSLYCFFCILTLVNTPHILERTKLLRKTVYHLDGDYKSKLLQKNVDDNLENELAYCLNLTNTLLKDVSIASIPIKEKINLLMETVENTQDHYTLSKDKDARTGHIHPKIYLFLVTKLT